MNYLLYKDDFVRLENKYNFAIIGMKSQYTIRDGIFYNQHGEVIPIVHNAGMTSATRCVHNFGFGKGYNRKKVLTRLVLHTFFAGVRWIEQLHRFQNEQIVPQQGPQRLDARMPRLGHDPQAMLLEEPAQSLAQAKPSAR